MAFYRAVAQYEHTRNAFVAVATPELVKHPEFGWGERGVWQQGRLSGENHGVEMLGFPRIPTVLRCWLSN